MKEILYISYNGMTDPLGQSQVLPYLVSLSSNGYRFTILSFEKKARYEKDRKIIEDIVSKSAIKWVPLTYTEKPPILSKIYDRWQMRRTAIKLYKQFNYDLIHCRSYIAAEIGLMLKQRYKVKFLFDMRGFWADEKVDSGQWHLKNPIFKRIYKYYKLKERSFLLNANAIVSLTQAGKNELIRQNKYSKLSIDVIPCCADLNHFNFHSVDKQTSKRMKAELGIPENKKIITYLGSVGGWYMTNEMFDFFKQVLAKYDNYVMLLITKDNPEKVVMEAEQRGVEKSEIIVISSDRKKLPEYLSITDYSVFFIRPTYSKIASSPTKHAELMGMGIPVICNDIGDTGSIINQTETGEIIADFNQSEYERLVNILPNLNNIDKEKIRSTAFQFFDLKEGANRYRKIYERIL